MTPLMGRVRFRGGVWVKSIFLDSNVDPGSTKDVDPGTCLTWQNHGDNANYILKVLMLAFKAMHQRVRSGP